MADIEFRPDQQIPAGRYIVILRPVPSDIPVIENPEPAAEVPDQDERVEGEGSVPPVNAPANYPNVQPPPPPSRRNQENIVPPNTGMNNDDFDDVFGENTNNSNSNNLQQGGKKKRNNTTKKPKKAKGTRKLSGYMKFAQEVRPRILKENPALRSDIPGMGRKIGEMWRGLSANEKARY
jgi:hypothetical protein